MICAYSLWKILVCSYHLSWFEAPFTGHLWMLKKYPIDFSGWTNGTKNIQCLSLTIDQEDHVNPIFQIKRWNLGGSGYYTNSHVFWFLKYTDIRLWSGANCDYGYYGYTTQTLGIDGHSASISPSHRKDIVGWSGNIKIRQLTTGCF